MNNLSRLLATLLISATSWTALADSVPIETISPDSESSQVIPPQIEEETTAPSKASLQPAVPKLVIRWECKECSINEKVAPLIEKNYADEAVKNGYVVSETETADIVITDYRQRQPGVRVMFGVLAGRDRLGVRILYREQERTASDYSANAWFGMNSLCESVAKQSYEKVISIIQSEQPPVIQ